MCYFPVFLCFVCFLELHGFHKETDLMTMTITSMCTGEVIKPMTLWGNVNLLSRTSSQIFPIFSGISCLKNLFHEFLKLRRFFGTQNFWKGVSLWLIAGTILLLFWTELAALWVRHLSQECATQGDGWNLGLKAYDMKCQDGVCA